MRQRRPCTSREAGVPGRNTCGARSCAPGCCGSHVREAPGQGLPRCRCRVTACRGWRRPAGRRCACACERRRCAFALRATHPRSPPPAAGDPLGSRRQSKVKYVYRLLRQGDVSESLTGKTVRAAAARRRRCCGRRRRCCRGASSLRRAPQQAHAAAPLRCAARRCLCCGLTMARGTRAR